MPTDYEARCADCEIGWTSASTKELLELAPVPDRCPNCDGEIETVEVEL